MQPLIEIPGQHGLATRGRPAMEETEPQGVSISAVLGALRRRKKLIVTTFAVVMAAVLGMLHFLPTHYTATASVVVEQADTRELAGKPVARGLPEWMPGDNSIMATQINILKTRALATQVVEKLELAEDPEFRSTLGKLKEQATTLAQRWFPSLWRDLIPWNTDADVHARLEQEAVQHLLRQLSVQQQGTSHVISVSFTSTDPRKAERIANAVGTQYLDNQIEAKYRATDRAYTWTSAQARAQRLELLEAENAAVDYMAAHGLTATNGLTEPAQPPPYKASLGGLPAQQLTSLQDDLASARTELAARQAKLSAIEAIRGRSGSFDSLPEVAGAPIIVELKKQDAALRVQEAQLGSTYNTNTPVLDRVRAERGSVARRMAVETENIVQSLRDEESLERDRVERLEFLMSKGRDQYAETERASVQLRELMRDASAKRALYESLLTRKNEISEQMALIQPDAEMISSAVVPTQPSFPNKLVIVGVGLIGALALGIVLAALVEYGDHSLRTGQQVERTLGITNLGMVPLLKRRDLPEGAPLHAVVSRQPQSMYAETVRSVLTQLIGRERGQAQVILVTSALPGEGKTTMTLSLAAAAARLGRNTVLVDLDLRHPSVARQAGLSVQADLVDYMDGKAELDRILHKDPYNERLRLIPLRASASADLLHSWDLQALIDTLRGRYECIFLDLPPSLAVSDIQVAGLLADSAVLVVQWGKTSASAAASAAAALARFGVPIEGAVLTQVDLTRHASYGFERFGEYHKKYLEYFRQFGGVA